MGIKRFSNEEIVQRIKAKYGEHVHILNPEECTEIVSRVKLKCDLDNTEWVVTASKILYHKTEECPTCKYREKHKDDFIDYSLDYIKTKLNKMYKGNVEIIDNTYSGIKNISAFHCKVCNTYWSVCAGVMIDSHVKCKECVRRSKIKPVENVIKDIKRVHGDSIFMHTKTYTSTQNRAKFECNVCHRIWWACPTYVINSKTRCPSCFGTEKIDYDGFLVLLKEIHGDDIEVIDKNEFVNMSTKIHVRCTKDNYVWFVRPSHLIYEETGCPRCAKQEPFYLKGVLDRINELYNGTVKIVNPEDYISTNCRLNFRCTIDGCVWDARVSNVIHGRGCPKCSSSKLEQPIHSLLVSKNCKFKYNKALRGCKIVGETRDLKPDFLFENYLLVFELDGIQHMLPFYGKEKLNYIQRNDIFKNQYFKKNGYILIRAVDDSVFPLAKGNYITLTKLKELIEIGIDENGNVNLDVFRPYDFNRE